jgi:hypothetical protein
MPSLESLAHEFLGDLTVAEMKLVEAAPTGQFAVCGPSAEDSDPANYPRNADNWGKEREIRTELIRWICRNPSAKDFVDPKGIQVYGAKLIGVLDLSQVRALFPLALLRCRVTQEVLLRAIEIPGLSFDGTWVCAIKADGAEVKGGFTLRYGFHAEQQVRLHRARIGVDLDCSGGTFTNPVRAGVTGSGTALAADGAIFGGGVLLNNGFRAEGEVRLSRTHIRGDLDCCGGRFLNSLSAEAGGSGTALNADGVNVTGSIFLREVHAEGEVRFPRAKVGGDFDCGAATIANSPPANVGDTKALNLEGSVVGGNVVLNRRFKANGVVSLRGAQIAGQLNCYGGTFENCARFGAALDASLANVATGIFLGIQFRAEGEVRLQSAQIGVRLECSGGTFNNPPGGNAERAGLALTSDGAKVAGGVVLGKGFHAEGEVRLLGAQIEGDLDCSGGIFNNPAIADVDASNRALSAHTVIVKGNVLMRRGFHSEGEVSFAGASIEGNLEATSAELRGELNLETTTVKGALMLSNVVNPKGLRLTLTNASVGALADETAGWPQLGNLLLDGFVYERFSGPAPKDSKSRLDWLALQEPFLPQPYRQVAKVLREEGENTGSVEVLYEMERRVRARENRWWRTYLVNPALRWTIGYGYYPASAFWWLAGLVLLGFALYGAGYFVGSITPTDKDAYATFKSAQQFPAHYERFHAFIYSVENSLPFVKLGQVERWQADPRPQSSVWRVPILPFTLWVSFAGLLRWYQWLQILSGWVLGTLFIAGVTGIIRKD